MFKPFLQKYLEPGLVVSYIALRHILPPADRICKSYENGAYGEVGVSSTNLIFFNRNIVYRDCFDGIEERVDWSFERINFINKRISDTSKSEK